MGSGATVTAKRGFPDVIMPGDVRNDLYLTLEKAEFERGGKTTAKNVLATVSVHDSRGAIIQVSMLLTRKNENFSICLCTFIYVHMKYSIRK